MGRPLGLAGFLLVVWAVAPWPLVRGAAAFTALFVAGAGMWSWVLARGLASGSNTPVLRTFSGRRLEVSSKLENRSPLPTGLLFFHDSSGGLETWGEPRLHLSLPPFARFRTTFTVRGRERGLRTLGPLRVSGSDPAGLFPFVRVAPARTLIVYPPLHNVRAWPAGGQPTGARRYDLAPVDDVSRFRAYRDFRPGDPLSRISAAASARRGAPQVRTFDFTVARPTGVVVDLRAAAYPLRLRWALIEEAIETAATLIWELLGRGESVWLTVVDASGAEPTLGPGRGWAQARPFLERLAVAAPDKSETPPTEPPFLPSGPQRLLWVAPPGAPRPSARGADVVAFSIEEGASRGLVHP